MAGFSDAVKEFAIKAKTTNVRVVKATAIKLFSAVITDTPVNANPNYHGGHLRANWQISGKSAATGELSGYDTTGDPTKAKTENFIELSLGYEFTLTNNLPYAHVVEFGGYPNPPKLGSVVSKPGVKPVVYDQFSSGGYSKQAPQGCVRTNMARFEQLLNEAVREAK